MAAASYEARRYGVRSAMPSRRAARLCPELVFLPSDMGRYKQVSRKLRAILDDFSDQVEPLSLDEAYLDVTDDKAGLGSGTLAGRTIRQRVREELSLTCSVGVGPSKFVAKIASDHRKPDGLTVVRPHEVLDFIRPLAVRSLWGVGPATARKLEALGIERIGQLGDQPLEQLTLTLGSRAAQLWRMANGEDPRPVSGERPRRSRSAERTFEEDVTDRATLHAVLADQAERVCGGLTSDADRGRTVTLKLRYDDFTTVTRSETLPSPTRTSDEVLQAAIRLLDRTDAEHRPVRLIGVGLSNFVSEPRETVDQLRLPF